MRIALTLCSPSLLQSELSSSLDEVSLSDVVVSSSWRLLKLCLQGTATSSQTSQANSIRIFVTQVITSRTG